MKRFALTILIIAFISMPAQAKYSGGSGTAEDPYQIATAEDLLALSADIGDYNKHFVLTADIDLDPNLPGNKVFTTAVIMPGGGTFRGVFDGAGHKIANLTIDTNGGGNDYLGLFGKVYGEIKNLGLENVSITGGNSSSYLGGLVGHNYKSTIRNCHSSGTVISGDYSQCLGGLVGYNDSGNINDCYSTYNVTGGNYSMSLGGLLGENLRGSISSCRSTGSVNGGNNSRYLGGLVGENYGSINNCQSTGNITVGNDSYHIGGLVGDNESDSMNNISDCYATGNVAGGYWPGGLVGNNSGNVSNCYSTGTVTGVGAGGLAGFNQWSGIIRDCYSTGSVTGWSTEWGLYIGGLVGWNDGSISNCYFLTGMGPDNGFGTSLTDEQMKQQASFVDWDFITPVWTIIEGIDYPHLWWENTAPVADAGSEQTVYAWIDGIAEVNLDGSGSFDEDNQPLSYLWSWVIDGNTYDTNGVNPTIELPVGQHIISLIVNDGLVDSEPNDVNITVVPPVEANLCVMPKVLNCRSNQKRIMAILRLPNGITKDQIDTNQPILLYPGEIEADKVWISRNFDYKYRAWNTTILASFDKDELLDAIDDNGQVELTVVGRLKTGQYFFGTDDIRVICPGNWPWHHRPWWNYRWNCWRQKPHNFRH